MGERKRDKAKLFLWCLVARQGTGTDWNMGSSLWTPGNSYSECDGAIEQVAQWGCEVSFLTGIGTLSGHYPGLLGLGGPVWIGTFTDPFQPQLFCDCTT